MVKKNLNTNNLTMNTATKKEVSTETVINTSRLISVPVTYELAGSQVNFILPPSGRQVLPEGAKVTSFSNFVKVVK